jgi:hypothetical protein
MLTDFFVEHKQLGIQKFVKYDRFLWTRLIDSFDCRDSSFAIDSFD